MAGQAKDVDQASAALIPDLKTSGRGMLEEYFWLFGAESLEDQLYCQGILIQKNYGRDHNPRAFKYVDGRRGGIKTWDSPMGKTDEFCRVFNICKKNPGSYPTISITLINEIILGNWITNHYL